MATSIILLPFRPEAMTPAQLAAVSYLARYSGHTHALYAYQLRRWFAWCEANGLDALIGVQRTHVQLYIRHLRECGLRDSSICTMMHGVRGFFMRQAADVSVVDATVGQAAESAAHLSAILTSGVDDMARLAGTLDGDVRAISI